jgi:LysM repeat protein
MRLVAPTFAVMFAVVFATASCSGANGATAPIPTTTGPVLTTTEPPIVTTTTEPIELYTVKAGDTLAAIATSYDVSVQRLIEFNGITDAADLEIGQELLVPIPVPVTDPDTSTDDTDDTTEPDEDDTTAEDRPPGEIYVIEAGDTMFLIAQRFEVGTVELLDYNGLNENDTLMPGQEIVIPRASP